MNKEVAMTDKPTFAERRKSAGYTQQSLSEKTGLHIRLIQKFESGERDLGNAAATTVQKLAIAFGCKMEDLI